MATSQVNKFMQHLRCAALCQENAGWTDGQLLGCFIEGRDEAAFTALVRRHGPTVWGVCRRMLPSHHDAEDAFQATFLVLARKAASISPREMVPNWLYGVAYRVALKARIMIAKHRQREKQVTNLPEPRAATHGSTEEDLEALLDQELTSLPDKYRVAIVLCDLEGKTRKEAARRLKIPEGTLSSRLTTARGLLAKRFARHGVMFSTGMLAGRLAQNVVSASVPITLIHSTVKTATNLLPTAQAVAAGLVSTKVATLAEGALKSMLIAKLKLTMAVLAVAASALTAGELLYQPQVGEQPRLPKAEKPPASAGFKPHPEPTLVVVHQEASVHQLVYSADGKSLLTIGIRYDPIEFKGGGEMHKSLAPNSTIKLWDAGTAQLKRSFGEDKHTFVTALAIAPDGKMVAIAAMNQPRVGISKGTEVRLRDADTWQVKRRLTADDLGVPCSVTAIAFSPDGKTLALGGASSSVEGGCFLALWDVPNEKLKARLKETAEPAPDWALERQVGALAFSPDGRLLATSAQDTKLRVFDGQTGAFKNVWEKDSAASIWIAFSPDGKTLASVSRRDKTVKLWDVPTAKVQRILRGNKGWVTTGKFSPDGTLLATGGRLKEGDKQSGEVNLWDVHTGERKYALPDLTVPVFTAAFSPDGKHLAISGGNELVTYSEDVVQAHGKTVGEIRLVPLDALTTKQP